MNPAKALPRPRAVTCDLRGRDEGPWWGNGRDYRWFKAAPRRRAVMSTTGMTRS